ncbi:hypothetical protein ONE63_002438 [Megalurothrips usitatus]|uniref:Uncharacterized protein n=1 Tax=Megalurothrips usitatus TaxID=439358 RepID=A0AAV7XCP2_9NEOP|nr:hypothetical protein ONE63_002438 [Megalurothrips usitatus]
MKRREVNRSYSIGNLVLGYLQQQSCEVPLLLLFGTGVGECPDHHLICVHLAPRYPAVDDGDKDKSRPLVPPPPPARGTADENYPNPMYGHSMSQPVQGAPYYSAGMADRRPLQPMQPEGQSLMGKVAMRQQQLTHAYQSRAQPVPQSSMCLPPQPSVGFTAGGPRGGHGRPAYGQVGDADMDYPLSGQLPPEDMGYHVGVGARYPQHMMPQAQAQDAIGRMQAAAAAGMERYGSDMYCDPPPVMYSGFTPSRTSSPIRLGTEDDQQGYGRERLYGRQAQHGHMQQQQQQQPQLWARPVYGHTAPPPSFPDRPQPQLRHPREQGREPSSCGQRPARTSAATPPRPSAAAAPKLAADVKAVTATAAVKAPPAAAAGSRPATPSPSSTPTKSWPERSAGRAAPAAATEPGIRLLTGTVDNILTWGRKLEEEARPNLLFEIVGSLDSVSRGHWNSSRVVSLRSLETGATLSAVFWEIDMPLAPPPTGSIVSCVCRLGPKWPQQQPQVHRRMPRMQLLKMRAVSAGQVPHLKRMAYVSGHAVQQGALAPAPAPAATPAVTPPPSPLKQTLISSYTAPRAPRT